MRTRDVFSYSFSAIRLRKLRAGLTTLGVVIGIAAIVALLSITTGLQNTITTQLNQGLATDTLIVSPGGGAFGGNGGGGGFGGGFGGGGDSGFKLFVNDTQTINGLSPEIETSIAVIQRTGYIQLGDTVRLTSLVGVDFNEYVKVYGTTFVAENGQIPTNPESNTVVLGKRVTDPRLNGTVLFRVGDNVDMIWTNGTARPPQNATYTAEHSGCPEDSGRIRVWGTIGH